MDTTTQRPQDQSMQIGKVQARYWAAGSQGSPVVLIHGIGGYVETFWPNILHLAEQHRVYALDLVGFGRTPKPQDGAYTLATFVQFVHDFIAQLGLEHASLVGHSLGGGIATSFTLTYPQMVDRLVVVAGAAYGPEVALILRLISLPLVGEWITKPSLKGSRQAQEGVVLDKSVITDADVQLDYELSLLPGVQNAFLKTLRGLGSFWGQKRSFYGPIVERLPQITQPTLVIWGREDPLLPVKHAETARRIPNVQIQILERCGHYPQREQPAAFDKAVADFLCD